MPSDLTTRGIKGRPNRSKPTLLGDLRNLRVLVFHPKDADGELLSQQLQRIGCQVITIWPPPAVLPEMAEVVFYAVRPDRSKQECEWIETARKIPTIAMINYESPTVIGAAIRTGASAILTSPLRTSGILSSLAMAKNLHEERFAQDRRIAQLHQKLLSTNQISQAKAILMRTRNLTDEESYRIIREQAMSKRVATEEIARAIINADGVMSYETKSSRE